MGATERKSPHELDAQFQLMYHLLDQGFTTQRPVPNSKGKLCTEFTSRAKGKLKMWQYEGLSESQAHSFCEELLTKEVLIVLMSVIELLITQILS